jgi:hypothetical protein
MDWTLREKNKIKAEVKAEVKVSEHRGLGDV